MAAPEERELTAEQTEKLLQFQVPLPGGPVPAGGSGGGGAWARNGLSWAPPRRRWGVRGSQSRVGPSWSGVSGWA